MRKTLKALIIAALVASPGSLALAEAPATDRNLTIDDLLAIKAVSEPAISPDGRWIAYTVTHNDMDEDTQVDRVFMASRDGATVLALTGETYSASSPEWNSEGTQLAFLAARDDLDETATTQVWTLDMRGGEATPYTSVPQGVVSFDWSPIGTQMLLQIKDESETAKAVRLAQERGETPKTVPYVIDRLQFKEDGTGYLDRSRTHLYLLDGPGETPVQLTFGDHDDEDPVWSPDGALIAFSSNRTNEPDGNYNSDIWTVSATTSGGPFVLSQVTTNPGSDTSPAFSPDGKALAYATTLDPALFWYATIHLGLSPVAGGPSRVLTTALDRNVSQPSFTPDGKAVYIITEDGGRGPVSKVDVQSGEVTPVIAGDLAVYDFELGPAGELVALVSRPELPAEVFLSEDQRLTQVTRTNESLLAGITLAAPTEIEFESADGTPISGFIYPAVGAKTMPTPAILHIHGGPVAQFQTEFEDFAQLFAANGYSVVLVNPRGSSGYGQAFSAALFADWGNKDFQDVMAGVDEAVRRGFADEARLGVGGWSYGGILTNYVITQTGRFKAAVSGASEVIHVGNYGHDIYQREWELELGLPWETPEAWERITPFFKVGNVTTPTLVMGGQEDWNVPIVNSEQLYQALKRRGIDTGLIVYPGEDHSINRPSFVEDRYRRNLDWYATYLK